MARKRHLFLRTIQSFLNLRKFNLKLSLIFKFHRIKKLKNLTYYILLSLLLFVTEILPVVAQAVPLSLVSQSWANHSNLLLEQGKIFYREEKFDEAAKILEQAVKELDKASDKLNQSMALSNLSLVYQQQGKWEQAKAKIEESLKILYSIPDTSKEKLKLIANTLEVKGKLKLALGKSDEAFNIWQDVAKKFIEIGDKNGEIRSQINQTLALQELGLYREAFKTLIVPTKILQTQEDSQEKAIAYRILGNITRTVGLIGDGNDKEEIFNLVQKDINSNQLNYLDISRELLLQSLAISERLHLKQYIAEANLGLGNTLKAEFYRTKDAFDRVVTNFENGLAKQLRLLNTAIDYYDKASINSKNIILINHHTIVSLQARLNKLSLLIDFKKRFNDMESKTKYESDTDRDMLKEQLISLKEKANSQITAELKSLRKLKIKNENRSFIYAQINLAQNMIKLYTMKEFLNTQLIQQLLEESVQLAQNVSDLRAEAFALGSLGELYEKSEKWFLAQQKTKQALELSEKIQTSDIAYLWQWQLGRILEQENKIPEAITAYKEATKTLKNLRQDLTSFNKADLPFFFRDSVEPLYRGLVRLLLPPTKNLTGTTQENHSEQSNLSPLLEKNNISDALQFFEELQVLELENFLRCRLQDVVSVAMDESVDKENSNTAIIYPIIVSNPDRLEVLLKLPNSKEPIRFTTYDVSQEQLETAIEELRQAIEDNYSAENKIEVFQKLYSWLFKQGNSETTIESELERNNINTLIFVLDSALRNIPLPALYDVEHKQYLIEKKYSIALNLVPQMLKSKPFPKQGLKILAAGVSVQNEDSEAPEGNKTVLPIPSVKKELEYFINSKITNSRVLCNNGFLDKSEPEQRCDGSFTLEALEKEVKSQPFKVVHLATHGQLSSSPDDTYILAYHTGKNNRIDVNKLSELLRKREENRPEPIELLVLSACQTALGDTRAVLGIAGVSVQVGARSTIGSLIVVNDQATTSLMSEFYTKLLEPNVSLSKALHYAQNSLREKGETPKHWSPFVLVGNWR